jgi:YVTN family beta-propeller protein
VGLPIPVGFSRFSNTGVAIAPDGTKVYVANFLGTVTVIHRPGNTVVKAISVGGLPVGVAVTPDGTHVYVANFISNIVSVIARPGNAVVATIPVGSGPEGVAIGP